MARIPGGVRRPLLVVVLVGLSLAVLASAGLLALRWYRDHPPSNMSIPAKDPAASTAPFPQRTAGTATAAPGEPPFITMISRDGRYFLDQYGRPIYLRGDSPWSLMVDLQPDEAQTYITNRSRYGVNAMIVSAIGSPENGGPSRRGSTVDGLRPFIDEDVTRLNPAYWDRIHQYLTMAQDSGITVLFYPIDSWVIGQAFVPRDIEQCATYGAAVAQRLADLKNVMWMVGGDYVPDTDDPVEGSDADRCLNQLLRGIRATGDNRLFSIQLAAQTSTDNPYWKSRVDWNFVYSYQGTFAHISEAYEINPPLPAVLGESNYEGENNIGDEPTTNESLRRQALWTITSGGVGSFYGSDDWEFRDGWQRRLDSPGMVQTSALWRLIDESAWSTLRPDLEGRFLTGGRGDCENSSADVLALDCATATLAPTGDLALVYVPTARTLSIDAGRLAANVTAEWVDPSDGSRRSVPVQTNYTTPGLNADGNSDWLLLFH